jgi:hypothetical protein
LIFWQTSNRNIVRNGNKKAPPGKPGGALRFSFEKEKKKKVGSDLLFHLLGAVPLAQKGLTTLFGKGRGSAPSQ